MRAVLSANLGKLDEINLAVSVLVGMLDNGVNRVEVKA